VLSCAKLKDADESLEFSLVLSPVGDSALLLPASPGAVQSGGPPRLTVGQRKILSIIRGIDHGTSLPCGWFPRETIAGVSPTPGWASCLVGNPLDSPVDFNSQACRRVQSVQGDYPKSPDWTTGRLEGCGEPTLTLESETAVKTAAGLWP
jgi:hypothetical protein